MDWIHCNECFNQPTDGVTFLLTSCGHMFCKPCCDREPNDGKCKMCNSDFRSILLVPEMKSDVKHFFSEPDEMVKKLIDVLDFQKQHRMRLVAHWVSLNKKYQNSKSEIKKLSSIIEKLCNDLKEKNNQNKMLKKELAAQHHMIPKINSSFNVTTNTPVPTFSYTSSKFSTPKCNLNSSRQNFESKLITPHRLNRSRAGSSKMYSSSDSERRTIMLTPPSTIRSPTDDDL